GGSAALGRDLVAHVEPDPWFGVMVALRFTAGAVSRIELHHLLVLSARLAHPALMLVAADGHHFAAPLVAANGDHTVVITGAQLHLPTTTPIVAIILRGKLEHP